MRNYCVDTGGLTPEEAWQKIRLVYGPTNFTSPSVLLLMDSDIAEWEAYNLVPANDSIEFGKWLIWKLTTGTTDIGNLSKRKTPIDKIGLSYAPCPYSEQSNDIRTRIMLGLSDTDPLPSKADHTDGGIVYYMKTNYSGRWGFKCTFGSSCPGYSNGHNYIFT